MATLTQAARLIEKAGGRAETERFSRHHFAQAQSILDQATLPDTTLHRELTQMFSYIVRGRR
jgi:geranylgeranyl pyrophosphate synthase